CFLYFFFFQAEDGIRDFHVTGVQTCALPISSGSCTRRITLPPKPSHRLQQRGAIKMSPSCTWMTPSAMASPNNFRKTSRHSAAEIGRASCRERVERAGVGGARKRKRSQRSAQ